MSSTTSPRYVVTWLNADCQIVVHACFTQVAVDYLVSTCEANGLPVTVEPYVDMQPKADAFNAPRLKVVQS